MAERFLTIRVECSLRELFAQADQGRGQESETNSSGPKYSLLYVVARPISSEIMGTNENVISER
jgi:hypothetical protein